MFEVFKKILIKLIAPHKDQTVFESICRMANLMLDFSYNKDGVSVLHDIFIEREYSDYFPFYRNNIVVDVGAHYGYFSLFAAKNSGKNSRIIAIEPANKNFNILNKNIETSKLKNITSINVAVSDTAGKMDIFQGSNDTNFSLFSDERNALSSSNFKKIEVMTISDIFQFYQLEYINFLKLDCEGSEFLIIKNTDPQILDKINIISMEFHDLSNSDFTGNGLVEELEAKGFKIVKYSYSSTRMNLNYGKIIAMRDK